MITRVSVIIQYDNNVGECCEVELEHYIHKEYEMRRENNNQEKRILSVFRGRRSEAGRELSMTQQASEI